MCSGHLTDVALTTTYYMVLSADVYAMQVALSYPSYTAGNALYYGDAFFYYDRDIAFRTYYDDSTLPSVPLPAAWSLFASGLGVMGLLGWRRKRKAKQVA